MSDEMSSRVAGMYAMSWTVPLLLISLPLTMTSVVEDELTDSILEDEFRNPNIFFPQDIVESTLGLLYIPPQ